MVREMTPRRSKSDSTGCLISTLRGLVEWKKGIVHSSWPDETWAAMRNGYPSSFVWCGLDQCALTSLTDVSRERVWIDSIVVSERKNERSSMGRIRQRW